MWLEAFQRVSPKFLKAHADISERAGSVLLSSKGTVTFVDLVARFNRRDMVSHLMDMAAKAPESDADIRAVAQIIASEDWDPMWKALADPTRSEPFITALGYVNSVHAKNYLTGVLSNESQPEAVRLLANLSRAIPGPKLSNSRGCLNRRSCRRSSWTAHSRCRRILFAASRQHLIISANERWPLQTLLASNPDPTQGFAAFQKGGCIKCHKIGDQGPRIWTGLVLDRQKKQLFSAILKPSETISLGYESVSVLADDGKLQSGFVVTETKDTRTLRLPGRLETKIPKASIELRKRSKVSLMPKGIDAIPPQELVDVVGWLRTPRANKSDAQQDIEP